MSKSIAAQPSASDYWYVAENSIAEDGGDLPGVLLSPSCKSFAMAQAALEELRSAHPGAAIWHGKRLAHGRGS